MNKVLVVALAMTMQLMSASNIAVKNIAVKNAVCIARNAISERLRMLTQDGAKKLKKMNDLEHWSNDDINTWYKLAAMYYAWNIIDIMEQNGECEHLTAQDITNIESIAKKIAKEFIAKHPNLWVDRLYWVSYFQWRDTLAVPAGCDRQSGISVSLQRTVGHLQDVEQLKVLLEQAIKNLLKTKN